MNLWFLLFVVLSVTVLFFSILRYLNAPLSKLKRGIFISLRVLLVTLIFIAFLEPVFEFERLTSSSTTIPVLIDASLSMSLFQPESSIVPFLHILSSGENSKETRREFAYFLFGDSLRKWNAHDPLNFSDKQSFFPFQMKHPLLRQSQEIIIISDANWSNPVLSTDLLSEKTVYYLKLPAPHRNDFLSIAAPEIQTAVTDSLHEIPALLEGFFSKASTIHLKAYLNNSAFFSKEIQIDSGYHLDTVRIPVTTRKKGKYLIRIEAQTDSLRSLCHSSQHILPGSFRYIMHATTPNLDKRFLSLALMKRPEFTPLPKGGSEYADVAFFFDWDKAVQSSLQKLDPRGVAVFLGCLPCSVQMKPINNFSGYVKTSANRETPLYNLDISNLPPPARIVYCVGFKRSRTYLSAYLRQDQSVDTVPLIFGSQWENRTAVAVAAEEIWRWDFLPLSIARSEEQAFGFSELFLATIKDVLLSQASDQFLVFPSDPLTESASPWFSISFPAEIPVSSKGQLSFSLFSSNEEKVYDTTFSVVNTGSLRQRFTIPVFPKGNYAYTGSIQTDKKRYTISDTLYIGPDKNELLIQGQNSSLLQSLGNSLSSSDSVSIRQILGTTGLKHALPMKDHFRITRTWSLLVGIFMLMGLEWVLRKLWALD